MDLSGIDTPSRQPALEPVWSIAKDGCVVSCVIRHFRAPRGVEAQILYDGEMRLARQFATKEDAVHWALQLERVAERRS
jgi:hypothetical protein